DDVRAGLIRGTLPYYEHLAQKDGKDRSVRLRQARNLLQLAAVHVKERHLGDARDAYQRSLNLLETLNQESNAFDRPVAFRLGSAHLEYGRFLQIHDGDLENAERHYRQGLSQRTKLLEQRPDDAAARDHAAIAVSLLGTLLMPNSSRGDEAEAFFIQA